MAEAIVTEAYAMLENWKRPKDVYKRQHLGVLILLWRRHYHITQQELAKRTGLLQSYISGLEKGNIDPRISTLCRIVNGFDNMPLDTFFGGPDVYKRQM